MMAIQNCHTDNPLIARVLVNHSQLPSFKTVEFCWVPSHIGIIGNELADQVAKDATLRADISNIQIPYTDFKSLTTNIMKISMQSKWDSLTSNKLKTIKPNMVQTYLQSDLK